MKKILVSILLCLLPGFVWGQDNKDNPNHDYTNPHREQGATSYIDWNRILDDYWPVSTITFKVGQLSFRGTIENTKSPLTVAEITKMVRDVMNDLNMSDGMLGNIDSELANFQDITAVQWQQIGAEALDIALRSGLNPVGGEYAIAADAVSAVRAQLNGQDVETAIMNGRANVCDYLVGQGRDAVVNMALEAGADLGGDIASEALGPIMMMVAAAQLGWDLGDLMNKYHIGDRKEWTDKMMQRQMVKELFYKTVAQKLRQRLDNYYRDGEWHLKVNTEVNRENASIFQCAISQKWIMNCDLQKIDGKKSSRYGTYKGHMKLVAHQEDLDAFDLAFKDMVILSPRLPMRLIEPFTQVHDIKNSSTVLGDKKLESYDFELKVEKGKLDNSNWPFTRKLKEEEPEFKVDHTGEFRLQHGLYKDGDLNIPNAHAQVKFRFDYYGQAYWTRGRKLALYISRQENTNYYDVWTPVTTIHGDLTHTMADFVEGKDMKIMFDENIFAPLEFETGYVITPEGDPFAKQRAGSPNSLPYVESLTPSLNRSKSRSASPSPDLTEPQDPDQAGEDGIWVYDWKKTMKPELVEMIERGEQIVASGKLPSEFAYLLPEGLDQKDDIVILDDNQFMLNVKKRDNLTLNELIRRVKSHGFEGNVTLEGKQFDGSNGKGKECMVSFVPETNYLIVLIENEKKTETDETVSKIEKLQKRIEAISKEMQLHPEKAEELSEEMMELNLELQDEILKMQEKMLEQ